MKKVCIIPLFIICLFFLSFDSFASEDNLSFDNESDAINYFSESIDSSYDAIEVSDSYSPIVHSASDNWTSGVRLNSKHVVVNGKNFTDLNTATGTLAFPVATQFLNDNKSITVYTTSSSNGSLSSSTTTHYLYWSGLLETHHEIYYGGFSPNTTYDGYFSFNFNPIRSLTYKYYNNGWVSLPSTYITNGLSVNLRGLKAFWIDGTELNTHVTLVNGQSQYRIFVDIPSCYTSPTTAMSPDTYGIKIVIDASCPLFALDSNVYTTWLSSMYADVGFYVEYGIFYGNTFSGDYKSFLNSSPIINNDNLIASSQAAQASSEHDDVVNGYDNTSGNAANNSLESGLASYESEEDQAHNDFNDKMDSYTNPDTSDYVSGISFISSAVVLWWNGLGMFKIILLVGFSLMIFNYISRYRGG